MAVIGPLVLFASWWLHFQQALTITRVFQDRGAPFARAATTAMSIQHHAFTQRLDPFLVAAVVTIENPDLKPKARNPRSGATGIMQVMPRWLTMRPDWRKACGSNLANLQTNICFGVRVLRLHLDDHPKSIRRGLLAFNGCRTQVRCRSYPAKVLKRQAQYAKR